MKKFNKNWQFSKVKGFFTYTLPRMFQHNKLFKFNLTNGTVFYAFARNKSEAYHYFDKRIEECYEPGLTCVELKAPYLARIHGGVTYWDNKPIDMNKWLESARKHGAIRDDGDNTHIHPSLDNNSQKHLLETLSKERN